MLVNTKVATEGGCFLIPGDKCGTLHYITEVGDNKCNALSIFIDQNTVQAFEYADEYSFELSDDIIILPSSMYGAIKQLMIEYVDNMSKMLEDEALYIDFELKPGVLFTTGTDIYRALEIKDNCWQFDLFRIDEEFISNNWTASTSQNTATSGWGLITDDTLAKVQKRFEELLHTIAKLIEQFSYRILDPNR